MHFTCLLMPTSTLRYKIDNVRYIVSNVIDVNDPVRLLTVRTCIPVLVCGVLAATRLRLTNRKGFLPRRTHKTNRYTVWQPCIGERYANVTLLQEKGCFTAHRTTYVHQIIFTSY
uniref:GP130 n=1 Tax=Caviid herpesvirus 2 str. CIDMTR TaxID=1415526 RepID=U6HC73_9BETA|nr:GP130 [Caviid herpesvirus 2 str. CIDMTR]